MNSCLIEKKKCVFTCFLSSYFDPVWRARKGGRESPVIVHLWKVERSGSSGMKSTIKLICCSLKTKTEKLLNTWMS